MIHPDHIEVIDQKLQEYGSKVPEDFLDRNEHALGNTIKRVGAKLLTFLKQHIPLLLWINGDEATFNEIKR